MRRLTDNMVEKPPRPWGRLTWPSIALMGAVIGTLTILFLIGNLLNPWRAIKPIDVDSCKLQRSSDFPKIVHRFWDGMIPDKYENYLKSCGKLNPEYTLQMWNTSAIEAFIKENYPWVMEFYNEYPRNIQRYDVARYLVIHKIGGIYMDMDMNCSKDFATIIDSSGGNVDVILGQAFPTGIVNNFFIAKPKSQFFTQVIYNLANSKDETFFISIYETFVKTGPLFLWKNYFTFKCKNQIYVLEKFKIRGIWLTHDGAATWQSDTGLVFMYISNLWAASFSVYNCAIILIVFIVIVYAAIKLFCRKFRT